MSSSAAKEKALVQTWRYEGFARLGFLPPDALTLADSQADLHRAAEMKKAGATLEQIKAILL